MTTTLIKATTNVNFIVSNVILSTKGQFTLPQMVLKLNNIINVNTLAVKNAITRLCDNDYLEENGSYYTVMENGKSKRWGASI